MNSTFATVFASATVFGSASRRDSLRGCAPREDEEEAPLGQPPQLNALRRRHWDSCPRSTATRNPESGLHNKLVRLCGPQHIQNIQNVQKNIKKIHSI